MTQKQIDNYIISSVLGEGSTGTVYLGKDTKNGKQVAIKAINMKNVDNQVTKYLLQNEIKSLQVTNHPNVLRALDVIRKNDFCYVVTDYLPGKTLHQMIRQRGKIPQNEALKIFKGIVEGYAEIHRHKIVHRDLKPQNIMFSADGSPVICDFGYAEIGGYLPKPKMYYNVGSPAYMAPQSITGSVYSENSEVWSLGAIFYEMLQGKPYVPNDKVVMQTIMQIKKSGLVYPAGVSEFTKSILRDTMKLKPNQRLSVRDLVMRLSSGGGTGGGMGQMNGFGNQQQQHQSIPQVTTPTISHPPINTFPNRQTLNIQSSLSPTLPYQDKLNSSYTFQPLRTPFLVPDTPTKRPISSEPISINNPFKRNSMQVTPVLPITQIAPNIPMTHIVNNGNVNGVGSVTGINRGVTGSFVGGNIVSTGNGIAQQVPSIKTMPSPSPSIQSIMSSPPIITQHQSLPSPSLTTLPIARTIPTTTNFHPPTQIIPPPFNTKVNILPHSSPILKKIDPLPVSTILSPRTTSITTTLTPPQPTIISNKLVSGPSFLSPPPTQTQNIIPISKPPTTTILPIPFTIPTNIFNKPFPIIPSVTTLPVKQIR